MVPVLRPFFLGRCKHATMNTPGDAAPVQKGRRPFAPRYGDRARPAVAAVFAVAAVLAVAAGVARGRPRTGPAVGPACS